MPYKFALEDQNYADYASGKVFHNLPGHPAFPVRLASELFQRCLELRRMRGQTGPLRLYDPCCGGAYHLAVLGFLHREWIGAITASDIDEQAVAIARRNLGLLTSEGLQRRIIEIEEMRRLYHKASHDEARQSALLLQDSLARTGIHQPFEPRVFRADALQAGALQAELAGVQPDLVISDIPYGLQSHWQGPAATGGAEPLWLLLDNLRASLAQGALVAIASAKRQPIAHQAYRRVAKFTLGKRQVVILEAAVP